MSHAKPKKTMHHSELAHVANKAPNPINSSKTTNIKMIEDKQITSPRCLSPENTIPSQQIPQENLAYTHNQEANRGNTNHFRFHFKPNEEFLRELSSCVILETVQDEMVPTVGATSRRFGFR